MVESRIDEYLKYHVASVEAGDIDPSYAMLLYVCDRYELNVEQRYWVAWLYAMTYCGASAFYVYNEFPDFECVDVGRLQRWWTSRGREQIICQTDRRWVRSSNMFVPAFESYRSWIGDKTQHEFFSQYMDDYASPETRYDALLTSANSLYSFGQFALFLYLEALHVVTPLELCPTDLDLSKAWSCRYGLYYAYGLDHMIGEREMPTDPRYADETQARWMELRATLAGLDKPPTVWQTETMLCAYRKWCEGKRYVGSYIDRQGVEIAKMQSRVARGIWWEVLWQYRRETYDPIFLAEAHGHLDERGLSREWKDYVIQRTRSALE